MNLDIPIKSAGRLYVMQANRLEKLGIFTLRDLLFYVPFRYDDLSNISKIGSVQSGETVTIQGNVIDIKNQYTRRGFSLQKAIVRDSSGEIECLWFNQPFITKNIYNGNFVSMSGRIEPKGLSTFTLVVKDYEVLQSKTSEPIHTGRLVPVYSETRGLTSKWIRNRIKNLLNELNLEEYLPQNIKTRNNLIDITTAVKTVHFPKTEKDAEIARVRLSFDELFFLQLAGILKRREWNSVLATKPFEVDKFRAQVDKLIKSLPFTLTDSQKKSLDEIITDVQSKKAMNRLLQGDVGSGKTVVAAIVMYLTFLNGLQSVIMAPTEILATQHFKTISELLEPFGVKVELVTSSTKRIKNQELRIKKKAESEIGELNSSSIANNQSSIINHQSPDILIGTHALLHQTGYFNNLGLVVIDEQQRFGVEQRAMLREFGNNPHFLTMTATPIPRTVFLTMYGDLDLSVLSDMPKGRKIVKTWLVPKVKREVAYEWIKKQIHSSHPEHRHSGLVYPDSIGDPESHGILQDDNSNQVFIVCPFIEESENMTTVKAAKKEFEHLSKDVFTSDRVALLHGKLKSGEKNQILKDFGNGLYDILVATPVVEVGIDIPGATIMLIEAAERFGLSQLHQLRGRVGRNDRDSYCLLFTEDESEKTKTRLKSLETTYSGARLAEIDLKFRGAGDVFGTRQHGGSFLKIASFSDLTLIENAKTEAETIAKEIEKYPNLKNMAKSTIIQRVSPD